MKKRELKLVNHELKLLLLETTDKLVDSEYENARLENRVKMLRAGLEDGRRERNELRDEVAELKWLLFDHKTPTPNPQPQPLIRSTPRRFWRADRVPYMGPSGADTSKPRPWWKSAPS